MEVTGLHTASWTCDRLQC